MPLQQEKAPDGHTFKFDLQPAYKIKRRGFMHIIIKLLRQKNNYLKQFETISAHEYHRLCLGDYSHIDQFYQERQKLLNAIDKIDQKLKTIKPVHISEQDKKAFRLLIQEKRKITLAVGQKDLLIHAYLNDTKYDTVKDQIA